MYVKIVQTGGIIERFEYQKKPNNRKISIINRRPRLSRGYRSYTSIKRATKQIRLLIQGAIYQYHYIQPYLVTFTTASVLEPQKAQCHLRRTLNQLATFKDCIPTSEEGLSVGHSNNHHGLNVGLPRTFEYLAIHEYQQRGAIHYHVLIWDDRTTIYEKEIQYRTIQNVWGLGYVDCIKAQGHARLANYLAKYLSKGLEDSRVYGKRLYNASRGISRSQCFTSTEAVNYIQSELIDNNESSEIIYKKQYPTDFMGRCDYQVLTYLNKEHGI